ncbi:hypothetical protein BGZ60DRAFT_435006 [Tricladium varicosporioides]|nr:hypothetical protein BGZ60DRAFT_435006 [Hymenoscyphus varicosporioides]
MCQSLLFVASLAAAVNAAAISIAVGNGGLTFSPSDVKAAVGDILQFHFYSSSQSHNVVSGTFESPCTPGTAPFFSGTQAGDAKGDTTFLVNVTSTDPIYFYCAVGKHCINGMVGVVNGPAGKSSTEYKAEAAKAAAVSAPSVPTGGVLTIIDGSKTTSATSFESTTTAPATTSGSAIGTETGSSGGAPLPTTITQVVSVTHTLDSNISPAQTSTPQQTQLPTVPPRSVSKAWIAGAVIAPLLLLAAIFFAAYYIWRRKRILLGDQKIGAAEKRDGEWRGKAQLHGESMGRPELSCDQTREERTISELPAPEVVGSELDTQVMEGIR